jgi:hypothetical protein
VRFSLGEENDEADVDRMLNIVPPVIERLRGLDGRVESTPREAPAAESTGQRHLTAQRGGFA